MKQTFAFSSRLLTNEELRNSLSLLFSSCRRASSSSLCSRVSCSWTHRKDKTVGQTAMLKDCRPSAGTIFITRIIPLEIEQLS